MMNRENAVIKMHLRRYGIKETAIYRRDKQQLINDTVEILNNPKISRGTKKSILSNVILPEWTKINGRYKGCPNWSKKALDIFLQRLEFKRNGQELTEGLFHEQIVPRKLLEEILVNQDLVIDDNKVYFNLSKILTISEEINERSIKKLFDTYLLGAVVKKEEHELLREMPDRFFEPSHKDFGNVWLRYLDAGIELVEVVWNNKSEIIGYNNLVPAIDLKKVVSTFSC